MPDPRGRGFSRVNNKHHVRIPVDSPLLHGWKFEGSSTVDGQIIYKLGEIARMKTNGSGGWIGNILVDGEWVGFEVDAGVSLKEITKQVRKQADVS